MNDVQIFGLIVVLIILHISAVIFNIAGLFAYFQRNRIDTCKEQAATHIVNASLWGLFGLLTFPGIFIATEKFRYGFKFSKYENPYSEWYDLVEKAYRKGELAKYKAKILKGSNSNAEGRCIDIWED